jgi:choline dehydrogenase-like flavoprotein
MSAAAHSDYDSIVIGAGLGGCFTALRLVERGLSVLVMEAGSAPDSLPPHAPRPAAMWQRLRGRRRLADPADRWGDGLLRRYPSGPGTGGRYRPLEAFLGTGLGGSSAIYGAALGRLRRSDLCGTLEAQARGDDGELVLPTAWPIPFEVLQRYYAEAEALLRIAGERDPLDADDDALCARPPELSVRDAAIRDRLAENGLHPYRLKVGFDYQVPGCAECIGRRCPRQCKADGYSRALEPALASGLLRLETDVRVLSIAPADGRLQVLAQQGNGALVTRRGRTVVLAAGALNTPLLLGRSRRLWQHAPAPAMLGRGLMFHVSDLFTVQVPRPLDREGPKKTLAFRDFYPADAGAGEIQSTGFDVSTGHVMSRLRQLARASRLPGLPHAVEFLRPIAWAVAKILGTAPIFATITEDLPYASNRVWEDGAAAGTPGSKPGPIALSYTPSREIRARARRMRARIRGAFAPYRVVFLSSPATPNWGHPMGTCRMGEDPDTSVLTGDGHLRSHPAIFVADASAFPSSGGAGPALTTAAHALRVADRIAAAQYGRAHPAGAAEALPPHDGGAPWADRAAAAPN